MKLMAIDGNSIVNRAFFGIRELNAPDGTPTNAIYGFLTILQSVYEDLKPDAVCVAFDRHEPTFRHRSYDFYKAQRKPMPEELAVQMPILKEVLDTMGIPRLELSGFEADDILGTLGSLCERKGEDCVIVTGDKDSLQLVSGSTSVCIVKSRMGQTERILYTPEVFRKEYGFEPPLMVDLKALMGDSSDNIPGVAGIGEKTAKDLVSRYGGIQKIYAGLDSLDIRESVKKKLTAGEESAQSSYWLATIFREVPLEKAETCPAGGLSPACFSWSLQRTPELLAMMKRLGFRKMIEKWNLQETDTPAKAEKPTDIRQVEIESLDTLVILKDRLMKTELAAVFFLHGTEELELCLQEESDTVYTLRHMTLGEDYTALLEALLRADIKKSAHQVKDLMNILHRDGYSAEGFCFDTALAAYLLRATDSDYELPSLSARYLGIEADGAAAVAKLTPVLQEKLREMQMTELFEKIEMPLCRVLSGMEDAGFWVDRRALANYGESLNAGISQLQEQIWAAAGHEFNILSPKQLGQVLFDELALPHGKKTKTGWSTNVDVLEKLQASFPIAAEVLEYRTLTKLKSTYAEGLLKVIAPDGRIHTSFQMTVTATGRLSSTEPNLQNIPIRKELGAQIRNMFAAPEGKLLVDADYSQIELRLLAHISDDHAMQEAFLSGEDFHAVTASKVFRVPLEEVSHTLRSRAKAVNFGIVYGISAFSLAQDIGVRPAEAKEYMDAYLEQYSGVRDYMQAVVEQARRDGYVSTLFNRRRDLPELKSSNFNTRSFGERVALNMPIQGTAADIIKLAMVNVDRRLRRELPDARLVLQVHDELIVECPENEAGAVKQLLKEEMEHVLTLSVPLTVEAKAGKTWAEAH